MSCGKRVRPGSLPVLACKACLTLSLDFTQLLSHLLHIFSFFCFESGECSSRQNVGDPMQPAGVVSSNECAVREIYFRTKTSHCKPTPRKQRDKPTRRCSHVCSLEAIPPPPPCILSLENMRIYGCDFFFSLVFATAVTFSIRARAVSYPGQEVARCCWPRRQYVQTRFLSSGVLFMRWVGSFASAVSTDLKLRARSVPKFEIGCLVLV